MTLLLIALVQGALAGCPANHAALQADVQAAIKAQGAADWPSFERHVAAVHQDIGCLTEVVDVRAASEVHRMAALYFAHHGDLDNTRDAMRGLLSLDGSFEPAAAMVADNALLGEAFEAATRLGQGKTQDLPEGTWTVDGRPDAEHFGIERATLVQRHDKRKDVNSWYVFGGQIPPALRPESEQPGGGDSGGISSRPLLYGGLAGLAVAAGGFAYAELAWAGIEDDDLTADEMQSVYGRTHGVSLGSTALGLVGGGLVVGAVVVGHW